MLLPFPFTQTCPFLVLQLLPGPGGTSDGHAKGWAAAEHCGVRWRPPSEAGGGTLRRAVFREKLPEIAPNCAHVWCGSPCQGPTQPWEPVRLWSFILKGFVSLIERELCFLLREKPAVKTARLFVDSFYLSLRFLEGGISLGMPMSPCTGGIHPHGAGGPAPSLPLLGGEAPCPKPLLCLQTLAWPQGATGTPWLPALLRGWSLCGAVVWQLKNGSLAWLEMAVVTPERRRALV